jgi:ATP-binding cassette, subfamily B, bacterial
MPGPHQRSGSIQRSMRRVDGVRGTKIKPGTTKRVLGFLAPYRGLLIVFLVVVVIDAIVSVVPPLLYRQIIDKGIPGLHAGLIIKLALTVAGLAVFDAGLSLVQRYISSRIGEGLVYDMRSRVFSHVQKMPLAFFVRAQTGALVSRINNDVQGAQEAFTDVLSTVVGNLISVALVLVAMFVLSWQLTLTALVLLPAFMLPARWMGRMLEAIMRESYDLQAEMNNTMVERFNVSGALLVKLFGRLDEEEKSFRDRAGRVRDIAVVRAMYARVFFVALMLTAALATALVYGWGGLLTIEGAISIGTLVALTIYLSRLYGPITALSNINVDVMTTLVSFDRVFEVLDLKPMITEKPDAVPVPRGALGIEFEHVNFAYPGGSEVSLASLESTVLPERHADDGSVLHDVSFTVGPGQMVALVGPSGAGKTTVSQLVPRLYDPVSGSVRIGGLDLRDLTLDSVRDAVGVVTQDAHMLHESIRANLLYARPGATEDELLAAVEAAQVLSLIRSLPNGLDTVVGDRGYRLSGGEKQRLAIARLLLKAPDIVVLDEATAHLDSESERAVQLALKHALTGRTSLVIAHRLSTVRDADSIVVLDAGRVVETGRHEELLAANGLYAELYRTQFLAQDRGAASPPDGGGGGGGGGGGTRSAGPPPRRTG